MPATLPDKSDVVKYASLEAAMGAYARYAAQHKMYYLCAWGPWQAFAARLRPSYPRDRPQGWEISSNMTQLLNKQ